MSCGSYIQGVLDKAEGAASLLKEKVSEEKKLFI
jgi:hypothetical protein